MKSGAKRARWIKKIQRFEFVNCEPDPGTRFSSSWMFPELDDRLFRIIKKDRCIRWNTRFVGRRLTQGALNLLRVKLRCQELLQGMRIKLKFIVHQKEFLTSSNPTMEPYLV